MLKEYGHSPVWDRKLFTLGDSTIYYGKRIIMFYVLTELERTRLCKVGAN